MVHVCGISYWNKKREIFGIAPALSLVSILRHFLFWEVGVRPDRCNTSANANSSVLNKDIIEHLHPWLKPLKFYKLLLLQLLIWSSKLLFPTRFLFPSTYQKAEHLTQLIRPGISRSSVDPHPPQHGPGDLVASGFDPLRKFLGNCSIN